MSSIRIFALVLVAVAMAACNGGGRRRVVGAQCPLVYDPIPVEKVTEQKVWGKNGETDESKIPAGTYVYTRADIYYVDKSDLRVHVVDSAQKDGNFKATINCVRNARKAGLDTNGVRATAVTKIEIVAGQPTKVETKEYGFSVEEERVKPTATAGQPTDSLEKAYGEKAHAADYFMIKHNDVDYEIRSTDSDANGKYFMSVRFKKL